MSTQQKEQKFASGIWYKERDMGDWTAQNISINVDQFVAFLQENKKADGYVNLNVKKRRNPEKNNTHYVVVDEWTKEQTSRTDKPVSAARAAGNKAAEKPAKEDDEDGRNVPF